MQRTAAPLFSQSVATMMKRRRISMMSSIVLKVKIMVMKEGALEGTLARPALRRTAAMVFNRSAQINLPILTFLVLSFQQTFTERMAAFSSVCKHMAIQFCQIFPFLLLSWQLKLISTRLQMFDYTSEVAFERRCNCASWPMRRKEQNWRKGDSDQRYQKRFPSWTSRMIKRLIRKSACVSLYSILLSFSSEHLLLSGEEKRMDLDLPVHILLPALVKPSLW